MTDLNLSNLQHASLEQLISLSTERLLELENEADVSFRQAKELRDWITGVIAIQNVVQANNTDNNQQLNFGGENAKTTDNFC